MTTETMPKPDANMARTVVIMDRNASVSNLQRKLKISHADAAELMTQLEQDKVVSKANGTGRRKVLIDKPAGEATEEEREAAREALGHNSGTSQADLFKGDEFTQKGKKELNDRIKRIEKIQAQIDDLKWDMREVYNDSKERGFNVKAMRRLVKIRKMDKDERVEFEALMETYRDATGDT